LQKSLGLPTHKKFRQWRFFRAKYVLKPIITTLRTELEKLHALLHADTVVETAIRAETANIALIEADLNVHRAKIGVQFRAILTPEQLTTLKATQKEKPHRGGKHTPEEW